MKFITGNTILYCRKWGHTVQFYRDYLNLPVNFETDWFVEFRVTPATRLSIANDARASIKSNNGQGITLSLEVADIDKAWEDAQLSRLKPSPVKKHPWGERVFYLFDPEGHRIEIWGPDDSR